MKNSSRPDYDSEHERGFSNNLSTGFTEVGWVRSVIQLNEDQITASG